MATKKLTVTELLIGDDLAALAADLVKTGNAHTLILIGVSEKGIMSIRSNTRDKFRQYGIINAAASAVYDSMIIQTGHNEI